MAYTEKYANFDLATGSNDGTSEANAWQTPAAMIAGYAAGDRINVKKTSSRYSNSSHWDLTVNASATQRAWFRGYGSIIGDGVKFEMDCGTTSRVTISGDKTLYTDFDIIGDRSDHIIRINDSSDGSVLRRCKAVNSYTGTSDGYGIYVQDGAAHRCYAETNGTGTTSAAFYVNGGAVVNCKAKSTRIGIRVSTSFRNCQVQRNAIIGNGASTTYGVYVFGNDNAYHNLGVSDNTIYNFDYGIYFNEQAAVTAGGVAEVGNNIIYDATYGVYNNGSATQVWGAMFYNNGFGAITTANYSGFTDNESDDDYSISSDPFTDKANDDLSLTAGSAPIGAGIDAGGL